MRQLGLLIIMGLISWTVAAIGFVWVPWNLWVYHAVNAATPGVQAQPMDIWAALGITIVPVVAHYVQALTNKR